MESQVEDYIKIADMKDGIVFPNHDNAVKSIMKWCDLSFCDLNKDRFKRPKNTGDQRILGRRGFECLSQISASAVQVSLNQIILFKINKTKTEIKPIVRGENCSLQGWCMRFVQV